MALVIPALIQSYFTFKLWSRICLSPHRGQQSHSFFNTCRFGLWCIVSTTVFNSNFICSAERNCTAFYHRLAPSGVSVLIICPCFSRLFSSCIICLLCNSVGNRHKWLPLWPESSARASLNFFLERLRLYSKHFTAKCCAQCLETLHSSWL